MFRTQSEVAAWLVGASLFRVLSVVNLFVASEALLLGVFMLVLAGGISVYLNVAAEVYPRVGSGTEATQAS